MDHISALILARPSQSGKERRRVRGEKGLNVMSTVEIAFRALTGLSKSLGVQCTGPVAIKLS